MCAGATRLARRAGPCDGICAWNRTGLMDDVLASYEQHDGYGKQSEIHVTQE